ncbi:MAG: alpha/beta hydrolase [Phycisphaerales bacterium]|nr:alpha/beta hydrolase [Phycisphaerales bacterium]
MKRATKRLLVITPLAIVGILTVGAFWVWRKMGEPLYDPGMVRTGETLRAPLSPPQQPKNSNRWRVENDIEIHHFSHGNGPPVLFIHGGPGFPMHQVPAGLQRLAAQYKIHFYDQRGCGRSTKPFEKFTSGNFYQNMLALDSTLGIGAQIADIERIRRLLAREKLVLIGHSFGGFLATLYAIEFPERVEALVLVSPADMIVMPSKNDLFSLIRRRLPEDALEEFGRFVKEYTDFSEVFTKSEEDLAALNREFAKFFLRAAGRDPAEKVAELAKAGNGGWMVTAMFFGLGRNHDYREAFRKVSVPTLIVHGDQDLVPKSVSEHYAKLLANAKLACIQQADHFLLEEKPVEFSKTIASFLKETCGNEYNQSSEFQDQREAP